MASFARYTLTFFSRVFQPHNIFDSGLCCCHILRFCFFPKRKFTLSVVSKATHVQSLVSCLLFFLPLHHSVQWLIIPLKPWSRGWWWRMAMMRCRNITCQFSLLRDAETRGENTLSSCFLQTFFREQFIFLRVIWRRLDLMMLQWYDFIFVPGRWNFVND